MTAALLQSFCGRTCLALGRLFILLFVVIGSSQQSLVVCAQDVVVFWQKPRSTSESILFSPAVEAVRGQMIGFDESRLALRVADQEQPLVLASDQVAGLQVNWESELVQQANAAIRSSNFAEAIRNLEQAVNHPDAKPWEQKLILLQVTSSAQRLERLRIAAKVFILADSFKLPRFAYAYAPLNWTSDPVSPAAIEELKEFESSDVAIAQLIVASWKLNGADAATQGKFLEELAQKNVPPLSQLAICQLWRSVPPKEFLEEKLEEAISIRDKMPYALQAGPTAAIADRIERAGDYELAFDYWVEVALLSVHTNENLVHVAAKHLEALSKQPGLNTEWDQIKKRILQPEGSTEN